jgi:hypothetical protein
MARESHENILKRYQVELDRSRRWREQMKYDRLWRRLVDLYRGKHLASLAGEDRIVVNMAFATINVIAPSVAVNNPKITISARKGDDADKALLAELVVNYYWKHAKFQPQVRLAVNDALMVGHGWVKCGHKYKADPIVAVADSDDLETVPAEDPKHEDQPCADTEQIVTEDRPFVERVSFFDVFVDPGARHPSELRWIAQRIRRVLSDVKQDKSYKASARRKLEPTSVDPWEDQERENAERHAGTIVGGYVDIYEFYDLKNNTVCTFAPNCDEFLRPPKKNPFAFGNPFIMLRDYEVPDQFYPMGELESIEILQYELNETRSQIVNHRKKYQPKYLYNARAFEEDGLRALRSDAYNQMVPVENGVGINEAVVAMPVTAPPAEFYNQSQMIKEDMNEVSGVSDYMRGQMPDIRRTATEAAMLQDSQNARAADKLSRIEAFLAEVAERVIQLLQQFTEGEQVFRISGPNGGTVWVNYDRDYIAGEFDFEVEAGSTQPRNESFRRQSALQMVDALAPFADVIDPVKLVEHVMQFGFGVANPKQFIKAPAPMPELPAPMAEPQVPGMLGMGGPPPEQAAAPPMPEMPPML